MTALATPYMKPAAPIPLQNFEYYRLHDNAGPHTAYNEKGVEQVYYRGQLVPSQEDLAARWPEKFSRVSKQDTGFSEVSIRPGEATSDYLKRMQSIIDRETARVGAAGNIQVQTSTQPVTNDPGPATALFSEAVIDNMTLNELTKLAAEQEVAIPPSAKSREAVAKVLKGALLK